MKKKHPDTVMTEMVETCLKTLTKKGKEYSMDSDRLHNFRVAAALQDCSMRRALYGMMVKHITSIADMCCSEEEEDYTLELWEEKIQDNINYLLLLRAVIEEENYRKTPMCLPLNDEDYEVLKECHCSCGYDD